MLLIKGITVALCAVTITSAQIVKAPLKRHSDHPLVQRRSGSLAKRQQQNITSTSITAEEQLYHANRKGYIVEAQIGTPPQALDMIIDTGSPTVWLPGQDCPDTVCPGPRFNPSASSTYKAANASFSIQYNIGRANGTFGSDTVTIANLSVADQVFGLSDFTQGTTITYNGTTRVQYGVLGLGYPITGALGGYAGDVNFVFNLANRSMISNPIFSVYLDSQFQEGYSGEITFGGIDDSRYNGTIQYAPVMPYTSMSTTASSTTAPTDFYMYWTLAGTGITTSTGYNTSFPEAVGFVLDSGTTFSHVPTDVAQNLVNSITGMNVSVREPINNLYIVPCNLSSSGQTVTFSVASSFTTLSVNPVHMTLGVRELLVPLDAETPEEATTCGFGITSYVRPNLANSSTAAYVLGETVLRSFYTIYDIGQNRIGLAQARLSPAAVNNRSSSSANGVSSSDSTQTTAEANMVTRPTILFIAMAFVWAFGFSAF